MLVYTREELLLLKDRAGPPAAPIPEEIRRRTRRGTRAGVRVRERRERARGMRPFLPSIIMGNVRPLANKMDELTALVKSEQVYKECSLICFRETCQDSVTELSGFTLVRAAQSGKTRGGGLAVFVNTTWCNPSRMVVEDYTCTSDVELLTVKLQPYFLLREFSCALAVFVYIPPSAPASSASDVIHAAISGLQSQYPRALILIGGDFNHVSLSPVLANFTQYVDSATKENMTHDLLYANVKGAYRSTPLPPLGVSGPGLVHFQTTYWPVVRDISSTQTIKVCSKDTEEVIQECFTDWKPFQEGSSDDIDNLCVPFRTALLKL